MKHYDIEVKLHELCVEASTDPLTQSLVAVIQNPVLKMCDWDGDGKDLNVDNLNYVGPGIMIMGDDSAGGLVRVELVKGHLVLTANYGDEGNISFSPTLNGGYMCVDNELHHINHLQERDIIISSTLGEYMALRGSNE